MRPLLIPLLTVLVAGGAAILLIVWLRRRTMPSVQVEDAVARVLAAHGPARCLEATRLLRSLAERGPVERISPTWDAIELPLLQALPDCPPDYKIELINALDAAARACRQVETARAIMTMRNSLVA